MNIKLTGRFMGREQMQNDVEATAVAMQLGKKCPFCGSETGWEIRFKVKAILVDYIRVGPLHTNTAEAFLTQYRMHMSRNEQQCSTEVLETVGVRCTGCSVVKGDWSYKGEERSW